MTTLSKEDVVRWEAEADKFKTGEFTDTLDLKSFATLARADLVAENERLKEELQQVTISKDCYFEERNSARAAFHGRVKEVESMQSELTATRTELAAAEARESATRAILDQVMDDIRSEAFLFDGGNGISADTEDAADNLLDQPRDDSALREMIAGVYAECEQACAGLNLLNEKPSHKVVIRYCIDAIRALAEKKLASLTS